MLSLIMNSYWKPFFLHVVSGINANLTWLGATKIGYRRDLEELIS